MIVEIYSNRICYGRVQLSVQDSYGFCRRVVRPKLCLFLIDGRGLSLHTGSPQKSTRNSLWTLKLVPYMLIRRPQDRHIELYEFWSCRNLLDLKVF